MVNQLKNYSWSSYPAYINTTIKAIYLSVLGDYDFRGTVKQETQDIDLKTSRTVLQDKPDVDEIIAMTARIFRIEEKAIQKNQLEVAHQIQPVHFTKSRGSLV